jgi:hypothetical protein
MTNAKELSTRLATHEDAAAIAAIYNEGIAERIATFETEPRTAEQIVRQLLDKGDRFPTIVAERWSGRRVGRRRPPIEFARRMQSGVSGRSCPGSFLRTPPAWRCANVADSGSSASTSVTASSRASGETVSSLSGY